jgi:hypothetical protein
MVIRTSLSNTSTEMATLGSTQSMASSLGQPISEKLSRENHMIWKAQVLAVARGARLSGYLDGTVSTPAKTMQVEQAEKTMAMDDNPAYAS